MLFLVYLPVYIYKQNQKKTRRKWIKQKRLDIKKDSINCLILSYLAERAGFEPAEPFRGSHAFQACQFSHSCISPNKLIAVFFRAAKY